MSEKIKARPALTIFLSAIALLASCTGNALGEIQQDWTLSQVQAFDPADALDPSSDFVAFYARIQQDELQIRIDWLDQEFLPAGDLYLAIDSRPGGKKDLPGSLMSDFDWDTLIHVSNAGEIQSLDTSLNRQAGFKIRVNRDPVLDSLTIQMDGALATTGRPARLPFNRMRTTIEIQLFLVDPDSGVLLDHSPAFGIHDGPVAAAPVLLAFSNIFPAYTPALSMRRWDGAHSGPEGGRHGLFNLLRAAYGEMTAEGDFSFRREKKITPIFLLDLKSPASLPAVDFASALPVLRALSSLHRLILPDYQPSADLTNEPDRERYNQHLEASRARIETNYSLPRSVFLYTGQEVRTITSKYRVVFVEQPDSPGELKRLKPATLKRWLGKLVIPYSPGMPLQATADGPTLELRTALVKTALMNQARTTSAVQVLMLGGDLPASTWGTPGAARATFRYLESRPWINTLDAGEVLSLTPSGEANFTGSRKAYSQDQNEFHQQITTLVEALLEAPENDLTEAAWQVVDALYAPIYPHPEQLDNLRASYVGPAWILLHAAEWLESPYSMSSCEVDLDRDGQPECLLASKEVFSAFEAGNATLRAFFTRQEHPDGRVSVHQLVGPSSQLITGLSDPSGWQIEGTALSDPTVIQGGFTRLSGGLSPQPGVDSLAFTTTENRTYATYTLLPRGIAYKLEGAPAENQIVEIPILYDPWVRFQPGWAHEFSETSTIGGWQLLFRSQVAVQITTTAPISSDSYLSSLPLSGFPEDPNFDFGRGHYLPFPLFLVSVPNQPGLQVEIISP